MPKPRIDKKASSIAQIMLANLDSWIRSPRTILMLMFVAMICYLQICGLRLTMDKTGYSMNLIEILFYEVNFGCNMPITTIIFLIMISEMPQKITFHQYILIRSNRRLWLLSQILYCIIMVWMMLILILTFISIFALPYATHGTGWSAQKNNPGDIMCLEDALIDQYIIAQFSPLSALLIAIVPVFCFWLTMELIILLFSIWGKPIWGVIAYASITVAHVTIMFEYLPIDIGMPMTYSTLSYLTSGYRGTEMIQYTKVICGYLFIFLLLLAGMMLGATKTEFNV